MADRVISPKIVRKIWNKAIEDNTKSLDYLRLERNITKSDLNINNIGYIDYLKIDSSFFLKDVIVFPLFDANGKIRGITTRKLYDKFFIKFVTDNYPLIFSDYEFYEKTLVLTESPICALSLKPFLSDMDVSATLSASITLPYLVMLSTAKKIICVLDNDSAGQRASNDILKINPNSYIVPPYVYEDRKDPNELYKEDIDSFLSMVDYIKNIDRKTK